MPLNGVNLNVAVGHMGGITFKMAVCIIRGLKIFILRTKVKSKLFPNMVLLYMVEGNGIY